MKSVVALAFGCAILGLQGCATAPALRQGLAACELDGESTWLGPKPHIDRLLVLSPVPAPSGEDGKTQIDSSDIYSINENIPLIIHGLGLASIDVFLHGRPPLQSAAFGPLEGGVYRVSIPDEGDPACRDYNAYLGRFRAEHDMPDGAVAELVPAGQCLAFQRVSAWPELDDYTHLVVTYTDPRASDAGFFRQVEELRSVSGAQLARVVTYAFPPPLPRTCRANSNAKGIAHFLHGDE